MTIDNNDQDTLKIDKLLDKACQMLTFKSTVCFDSTGLMLDCSRGAVLTLDTAKYLIRCAALAGLTTLQWYTEDTYEVSNEPFFGYLRGRFSLQELRTLDNYADAFGIEIIACIQTLGHMGQILQWPQYQHIRDTSEVLLVHAKETYAFIERIITTISSTLRSRRINIGMDEVQDLGEGRWRKVFGESTNTSSISENAIIVDNDKQSTTADTRPSESKLQSDTKKDSQNYPISDQPRRSSTTASNRSSNNNHMSHGVRLFLDHLHAVVDICHRLGLRPMIWSDMLFSLASQNSSIESYYDHHSPSNRPTADVFGAHLPADVDLIHWDYCHTSASAYSASMAAHHKLGCVNPWIASGIWTWNRLWTDACLSACKQTDSGVKNVFVTLWGDDGNECNLYSALPGLIQFGLLSRSNVEDNINTNVMSVVRSMFAGALGGRLEDWTTASKIDHVSDDTTIAINNEAQFPSNSGKWLLWEDPSYAFLSPQVTTHTTNIHEHFTRLAHTLSQAVTPRRLSQFPLNTHLRVIARMAQVLARKVQLRPSLVQAYRSNDITSMQKILCSDLPALQYDVDILWKLHRHNWMSTFRPFGFEVVDLRYGGLHARLSTLHSRLNAYLTTISPMSTTSLASTPTLSEDSPEETILGPCYRLEELEAETYPIWPGSGHHLILDYSRSCTPARNLGTG